MKARNDPSRWLGHEQEPKQLAARAFVAADVPVDGLAADREAPLNHQPAADLLRTVQLAKQASDDAPVARRELRVVSGTRATSVGPFLRFAGAVRAIMSCAVPGELSTDRAPLAAHDPRYLGVGVAVMFVLFFSDYLTWGWNLLSTL